MKALIFDNKVVDVQEKEFPVHKDMKWVDAPKGCEVGWPVKNGKPVAPVIEEKIETYADKRRQAFMEKEAKGDLPLTVEDQFDEIWKALETAELHGAELPPSASSIIRVRRAIKTQIKKEDDIV